MATSAASSRKTSCGGTDRCAIRTSRWRCRTSRSRRSRPACATFRRRAPTRSRRTTSSPRMEAGGASRSPTASIPCGGATAGGTIQKTRRGAVVMGHTYKTGLNPSERQPSWRDSRGSSARLAEIPFSESPATRFAPDCERRQRGLVPHARTKQVAGSLTYFTTVGGSHNFRSGECSANPHRRARNDVDGSVPGAS